MGIDSGSTNAGTTTPDRRLSKSRGTAGNPSAILPNCPEYVIAWYACQRIGAIAVGNNPLYTEREMEHQLKDAGIRAIYAHGVPTGGEWWSFSELNHPEDIRRIRKTYFQSDDQSELLFTPISPLPTSDRLRGFRLRLEQGAPREQRW